MLLKRARQNQKRTNRYSPHNRCRCATTTVNTSIVHQTKQQPQKRQPRNENDVGASCRGLWRTITKPKRKPKRQYSKSEMNECGIASDSHFKKYQHQWARHGSHVGTRHLLHINQTIAAWTRTVLDSAAKSFFHHQTCHIAVGPAHGDKRRRRVSSSSRAVSCMSYSLSWMRFKCSLEQNEKHLNFLCSIENQAFLFLLSRFASTEAFFWKEE